MTDVELRLELQRALGAPVAALRRRAHPYASTHPVEDLEVTMASGDRVRLVLKELTAGGHGELGARARLLDPRREPEAYTLLSGRVEGTAACHACAPGSPTGGGWLLLEAVDAQRPLDAQRQCQDVLRGACRATGVLLPESQRVLAGGKVHDPAGHTRSVTKTVKPKLKKKHKRSG